MRNESRSMNHDLSEGMVEGKYKDARKGWGGEVESATEQARAHLDPNKYDIIESPLKVAPDGTLVHGTLN